MIYQSIFPYMAEMGFYTLMMNTASAVQLKKYPAGAIKQVIFINFCLSEIKMCESKQEVGWPDMSPMRSIRSQPEKASLMLKSKATVDCLLLLAIWKNDEVLEQELKGEVSEKVSFPLTSLCRSLSLDFSLTQSMVLKSS